MNSSKKKRVLRIAAVIAIVTIITVASFTVFYYSLPEIPPWQGSGDWVACAAVTDVSPEEALRIAVRKMGISRLGTFGLQGLVFPEFINETGWAFVLTCTGGLNVGEQDRFSDQTSPGPAYAWAVAILPEHSMCTPQPSFVRWHTKELLAVGATVC